MGEAPVYAFKGAVSARSHLGRSRITRAATLRLACSMGAFVTACSSAVPVGPCAEQDCSGHGECVVGADGEPRCTCGEGYRPDGLDCVPVGGDADGDADGDLDADNDGDAADGDADGECVGEEGTPGMVRVPAGSLLMGCPPEHFSCCEACDDTPQHEVLLDAYEIDRTEVTVAEYLTCVGASACPRPRDCAPEDCNWGVPGREQHPATVVTWQQGRRYCTWAGKRLCTEAEWERAARGDEGLPYPWGTEPPSCELAVIGVNGVGSGCGTGATFPVGSRPADCSPFGALDMLGNVWEWTADWYDHDYYEHSPAENPSGPADGVERVIRGASYLFSSEMIASLNGLACRTHDRPDHADQWIGFRCCRSM